MELATSGEVYGIRTGTNGQLGTVAIKIGTKVVRFKTLDAHLWTPGDQVRVAVYTFHDEPLVITQGNIDD